LAAFVAPARRQADPQAAIDGFMREKIAREQLAEDARQANLLESGRNSRHAGDLAYDYANLDETRRHQMETEADALRGRMQTQAEKQAAAYQAVREAAAKGAPRKVIGAMTAEVRRLGGTMEEVMTSPEPGPPPKTLAAFDGMTSGMWRRPTEVEDPPPPEQPMPTGRFKLGDQGGEVDIPAIHAGQQAQNLPGLAAFEKLGTPIDRAAYSGGARAALQTPGLLPAEAIELATKTARQSASDANANARAAQIRAAQQQRIATSGANTDTLMWDRGRKAMQSELGKLKVPELHGNMNLLADGLEKLTMSNGVLTNQVAFAIVKANGVGQMSNQEFTRSVGGEDIATKLLNWYSTNTQGDLSSEQKARFRKALAANYKFTKDRLARAYVAAEAVRNRMPHPSMQEGAAADMDALFGDYDFHGSPESVTGAGTGNAGGGASSSTSSSVELQGPAALDLSQYEEIEDQGTDLIDENGNIVR
jgi:hypothetical protein